MKIEFTTDIRRPPREVWTWLTEPDRLKQRMKGLVSTEGVDPRTIRVGSTAKITIKEGGRLATYDERFVEWEPQRRLAIVISSPTWRGLEMIVGYRLEDLAGSTRLHYEFECRTTRTLFKILKILAVPFGFLAKRQARGFMNTLKRLAESEGAAAVTAA